MHEYSIVQALLAEVHRQAQAHAAASIRRLHVQIGEISGVEIPLFETAYRTFRQRTICEHAELEVHPIAVHWICPRCERSVEPGDFLRCSVCGIPARLGAGDEIVLQRIEMEVM